MTYHVIAADEVSDLMQEVNEYLAIGWEPQGGVQVVTSVDGTSFFQAIVKRA